eukprot:30805-Pelagococcus_subviridis.AAC.11
MNALLYQPNILPTSPRSLARARWTEGFGMAPLFVSRRWRQRRASVARKSARSRRQMPAARAAVSRAHAGGRG